MKRPAEWENIPAELKELNQWVAWCFRTRGENEKPAKPPLNPNFGNRNCWASVNERHTWGSYEEAVHFYEKYDTVELSEKDGPASTHTVEGIGFVFTADDDFVGVDFDNCLDPATGKLEEWVRVEVEENLRSYAEISPSGTGIKVICRGKLHGPSIKITDTIEMYDEKRFFTLTGNRWVESSLKVNAAQGGIADLYSRFMPKPKPAEPSPPLVDQQVLKKVQAVPDEEIIRRLRSNPTYDKLWSKIDGGNASDGDFALLCKLAFYTGKDSARMDRLFRQSTRIRPKWDERHGNLTYGEMSIQKAIQTQKDVWTGAAQRIIFLTPPQLCEVTDDEPNWFAWPILARGVTTVVDGAPKAAGKTTFVLAGVAAILKRKLFLGKPTQYGGVMLLSEQNPASLVLALDRAGLTDHHDFTIATWGALYGLKWSEILDQAAEVCREREITTLIVDTFAAVAGIGGDDENKAGVMLEALNPLTYLVSELNLACLITRHDRKSGGEAGQSGRGSSALTGKVDTVLQLTRPPGNQDKAIRQATIISRLSLPDQMLVQLKGEEYVFLGEDSAPKTFDAESKILHNSPTRKENAKKISDILRGSDIDYSSKPAQNALNKLLKNGQLLEVTKMEKGKERAFYYLNPLTVSSADRRGSL